MSGSRTIIADEDRLPNSHPGEFLREDFLIGSEVPFDEVVTGAGLSPDALRDLLAGRRHVDAAIDARLTRYFGMGEGFFLRLQNMYDLEEVHRADGDALNRIVPRAA